jgi:hypothetical protein
VGANPFGEEAGVQKPGCFDFVQHRIDGQELRKEAWSVGRGSARPLVWEGRSREAPSYPNF